MNAEHGWLSVVVLLALAGSALAADPSPAPPEQRPAAAAPVAPAYQAELDRLLNAEDLDGANALIDRLAKAGEIDAVTATMLHQQVAGRKIDAIISHSRRIRESLSDGTYERDSADAVRLRRLIEGAKPAADAKAPVDDAKAPAAATAAPTAKPKPPLAPAAPPAAKDDAPAAPKDGPAALLLDRARAAAAQGRLLPPDADNALLLAGQVLDRQPDQADAIAIVVQAGAALAARIAALDAAGEPNPVMRTLDPVLAALPADAAWTARLRAPLADAATALIRATEAAIERDELTTAGGGRFAAADYLRRLAALSGRANPEVQRLVGRTLAAYEVLVDQAVRDQDYATALRFVDRMTALAEAHGHRPAIDLAALRAALRQGAGERAADTQLLTQARAWYARGNVIDPPGSNALELAAQAARRQPGGEAVALIATIVERYLDQVDVMIEDGNPAAAAKHLQRLAQALDAVGYDRDGLAEELAARAASLQEVATSPGIRAAASERDPPPASP